MSQTKTTNSYDNILEKKNPSQDMNQVKESLIDKFKREKEEKENKLTSVETTDDIEIVDFVNKNKQNFQEALEVAETPEQIEETIRSFNPMGDYSIKDKVFARWANRPSYPYHATIGSFFSYHIMSFLLGRPKTFGAPDFIYYLSKDRINAFPEHFKNAKNAVESENIQTTHKWSELMAFGITPQVSKVDAHSAVFSKLVYGIKGLKPRGTNKLGVLLITFGVALAFVFSGGTAINKKIAEYKAHSQMVESAEQEIDRIKENDKKLEADFMAGKITKEELKMKLEYDKAMIESQQQIIDGK